MNKLLWIFLIALWIAFCTWMCWYFICGPGAAKGADTTCSTMNLNFDGTESYNDRGNVKFLRSSSNLILSNNYLDNGLASVNNYLIDNTNRSVTITGLYESNETNNNASFNNLGEARADQIRQKFLSQGVRPNQIKIDSRQYEESCTNGDTLLQAAAFTFGSL